jgi:hypothetical protein
LIHSEGVTGGEEEADWTEAEDTAKRYRSTTVIVIFSKTSSHTRRKSSRSNTTNRTSSCTREEEEQPQRHHQPHQLIISFGPCFHFFSHITFAEQGRRKSRKPGRESDKDVE